MKRHHVSPIQETLHFSILIAGEGVYGKDWGQGNPIRDDFSRLYILEEGSALVETEAERITLRPGEVYLFPAGRTARYRGQESMHLRWIHFRLEAFPGLDIFARFVLAASRRRQTRNERATMRLLFESVQSKRPAETLTAIACLADLVAPFLPDNWDALLPRRGTAERLMPAIHRMQANLAAPLKLANLAEAAHLHPTYFSNRFKAVFGVTPIQYLTELRLREAKRLLWENEWAMDGIAKQCGFRNGFYFSRVFRKHTGLSPSAYRQTGERSASPPRPASA